MVPAASPPPAAQPSAEISARILPPSEWARLAGTPVNPADLSPDNALVVVVEHHGTIVGCWMALNTMHVEGLWIAPEHQGHAGTARALMTTMVGELLKAGVDGVLTSAITPEVEAMIRKAGGSQVPGTLWIIPLKEPLVEPLVDPLDDPRKESR